MQNDLSSLNENHELEQEKISVVQTNDNVRERFSKSDPVEIMRVENIFIKNHSFSNKINGDIQNEQILDENNKENEEASLVENQGEAFSIHTLNINSGDDHINKENIMFSNTEDIDDRSINKNDFVNPDLLISPLKQLSHHDLSSYSNKILDVNNDIHENENRSDHDHNSYDVKDTKIEDRNHKNFTEFFEKIENFFSSYINSRKFHLFSIFLENFISLISKIEDDFLDNISHLQNKLINYRFRHSYDQFRKIIKTKIISKKYDSYNKKQCEKFTKYRHYKMKTIIFDNLKFFAAKKATWIKHITRQLKQSTIW